VCRVFVYVTCFASCTCLLQEMDYRNEAQNAVAFDKSLDVLGYVSVV